VYLAAIGVPYAEAVVICVGDVEAPPEGLDVIGLIEEGLEGGSILVAAAALAYDGFHPAGREVQPTDLVVVGVRHIEGPLVPAKANGMLEQRLLEGTICIPEVKEARSHEGFHGVAFDVADGGVFAIGEVEAAVRVLSEAGGLG
jgi:hypothetical protein